MVGGVIAADQLLKPVKEDVDEVRDGVPVLPAPPSPDEGDSW